VAELGGHAVVRSVQLFLFHGNQNSGERVLVPDGIENAICEPT
jgi:hypothetical protein